MRRPAGWMQKLTGRGAMRSPGAPSLRREVERQFWEQVATGMTSEKAAEVVGVSQAVGTRWFRHRSGMPLFMSKSASGRYLSFAEREDIGLLRAQDVGVREIACRIERSPSTVSRELTRNAATRGGKLEYRASVAQWKAELVARRPKPAKLVTNPRLLDDPGLLHRLGIFWAPNAVNYGFPALRKRLANPSGQSPVTGAAQCPHGGRNASIVNEVVLNSCLLLRPRVFGRLARIACWQIESLFVFPVPALQSILGGVTQLPNGWPHALAELDVELDRLNPVFV